MIAANSLKDWGSLGREAKDLRDQMREVSWALEFDRLVRSPEPRPHMTLQDEYRVHQVELLERELLSLLGPRETLAEFERHVREIQELSDELHDCARDGKLDAIPGHWVNLKEVWPAFWEFIVSRAPDLEK
jgi:hypothetical protein